MKKPVVHVVGTTLTTDLGSDTTDIIDDEPTILFAYNDGFNQSAHMKALICQLPYIPKFVLAGEMSSLVPLLQSALKRYGKITSLL